MPNLSGLKVGDAVTVFSGGQWGPPEICRSEVSEITKAGNIRVKGYPDLWNSHGYRRGNTYRGPWIDKFDQSVWDGIMADRKDRHDRRRVETTLWHKLPIEQIRAVLQVLDSFETKEAA